MKINIQSILHISFLVKNLDDSLAFYMGILGLERDDSRPEMSYPGAWLRIGGVQQLHLLRLPNPDSMERPEHGGHDRHVAFKTGSIMAIKNTLIENNISFTQSQSRANVIFLRDPDENALELIGDTD